MQDILSDIVAHKRQELIRQKAAISEEELRERVDSLMAIPSETTGPGRSMKQSLAGSASGIIAEFKRKSPSKGWIHQDARPDITPPSYEVAGASALSILTDTAYFGGSLHDIVTARPLTGLPILRKDFIVDPYQLLQAKAVGADAVLLIAACLSPDECHALNTQAHELGLETLLEVHSDPELEYADCVPDMVGVNNRNLGSFITDVNNSFRLAEALREKVSRLSLPSERVPLLVSESGISKPDVVKRLRKAGFRGFLMGEAFMKCTVPGDALRHFIQQLSDPNASEDKS